MTTLRYRRQWAGLYFAQDEHIHYTITRAFANDHPIWTLSTRRLTTTAGVRHAVGQTIIDQVIVAGYREGRAIAQRYSDLGDSYDQSSHGYQRRMTCAVREVIDETTAKLRAEIAELAAATKQ